MYVTLRYGEDEIQERCDVNDELLVERMCDE